MWHEASLASDGSHPNSWNWHTGDVSQPNSGLSGQGQQSADAGDAKDVDSRRRALGAGIGLAVVVAAYSPSGLGDSGRLWAAWATILIAVLLSDLLLDVRRLLPAPGVAPLTILAALLAIYLSVPETDQVPVVAVLPVGLVAAELVGRRQLGVEWYAVAAAAVGWAGMFGASGRQSALVGALFAWWAVALLPLVAAIRPSLSRPAGVVVALIAAIAVVVMARTGGIATVAVAAWLSAALIATASFAIALAAATLMKRN